MNTSFLAKTYIKFLKKNLRIFLVFFSRNLLALRIKIKKPTKKKPDDKTKKRIAILSNTSDIRTLFDSPELENHEIGLIISKHHSSNRFLPRKRFEKLKFLYYLEDSDEEQYSNVLIFCKAQGVDLVLLQAEDSLIDLYNYLNRELNNKGNSKLAARCSMDKTVMRETLNKNNISVVKNTIVNNLEDLDNVDFFPCVVKPSSGLGSEGVVLAKSKAELRASLYKSQASSRTKKLTESFFVEQYIEGRQFDIEGIINNGNILIYCIVEENYSGFFPYFNANWFFFNAFIPKDILNKIEKTVQSAFNACELKHGAFHCELRIDKNKNVKIIEFSNRIGGQNFELSMARATGRPVVDLYVHSMLGENIIMPKNENNFLLEKYMTSKSELKKWQDYIKLHNFSYTLKPLSYRGQIAILRLYCTNESEIRKIGKDFNLDYIKPLKLDH